ncbi:MAG: ATP-dependent Clp protease ATP-binding subunit [Patescibacteria group bacterium]
MSPPPSQENNLNPHPCAHDGKAPFRCSLCYGTGVVWEYEGKVFCWARPISTLRIMADEVGRSVHLGIGGGMFCMAALAVVSLGYLVVRAQDDYAVVVQHLRYGSEVAAVGVWIGLLAASYLFYRFVSEQQKGTNIRKAVTKSVMKGRWSTPFLRTLMGFGRSERGTDIAPFFTEAAQRIIEHAYEFAKRLQAKELSSLHILASAVSDPSIGLMFSRLSVDGTLFAEKVKRLLSRKAFGEGAPRVNQECYLLFLRAFQGAFLRAHARVKSTDLLIALSSPLCVDPFAIFTDLEITERAVGHVAEWIELHRELVRRSRHFARRAAYKPKGAMNRTYTSVATPLLDRCSRDLTMYARAGALPLVVGREREVGELFRVFSAGEQGVLLVGEEGAGKSSIIGHIADAMASEEVPHILGDKRLIELSVPALVAGGGTLGGMEDTLLRMSREIRKAGNIILVVENVHALVGTRSTGGAAFDIAGIVAELLEHKQIFLIATTTPQEAREFIENSPLGRLLARVDVGETDREQTIRVLESKAPYLEGRLKVYYSYPALEKIVDLSLRYLTEGHLPDKAIRLMEEAGEAVREERKEWAVVHPEDVAAVVSEKTRIPLTSISEDESSMLLSLEVRLHERIIDQEEAVNLVANAIRRGRTELRDQKRPIASFLFLGPTGVGKTEVARAVAELYYGKESAMVRLDMSEYQGADALDKLLGSVAAGAFGYLTEAIRRQPFSLVVLDEFEKASSDVLNLFLQVLEDGRLTDAHGRTVNFTNAIIIGTSNAGAELILSMLRAGDTIEKIRTELIQNELPKRFKPELLNRFDGVVVFKPLSVEHVQAITRLMLSRVERGLNEKGIGLKVEEVAVMDLAREGFDLAYGARPLRRLIQERVEDPIAQFLLAGQLARRDVVILEYGGRPRVEKAPPL